MTGQPSPLARRFGRNVGFDQHAHGLSHALWRAAYQPVATGAWRSETLVKYDSERMTVRELHDGLRKHLDIEHSYRSESTADLVWGAVIVGVGHGEVSAEYAKGACLDKLRDALRLIVVPPKEDRVATAFWYRSAHGATSIERQIKCPTWAEVARNYPAICDEIDALVRRRDQEELPGRMVFWHGLPGTGKTYAIRALMREWKQGHVSVVTDPEQFFAATDYIFSVVLKSDDHGPRYSEPRKSHRHLIVVEDCADIVLAGSRATGNPGMAKLLNLTDGLIGQGMDLLFLITSNEKIGEIDPALLRPGRCLQVLEFPTLTSGEAAAWAGNGDMAQGGQTLAELYANRNGSPQPSRAAQKVGF